MSRRLKHNGLVLTFPSLSLTRSSCTLQLGIAEKNEVLQRLSFKLHQSVDVSCDTKEWYRKGVCMLISHHCVLSSSRQLSLCYWATHAREATQEKNGLRLALTTWFRSRKPRLELTPTLPALLPLTKVPLPPPPLLPCPKKASFAFSSFWPRAHVLPCPMIEPPTGFVCVSFRPSTSVVLSFSEWIVQRTIFILWQPHSTNRNLRRYSTVRWCAILRSSKQGRAKRARDC